MSGKKSVSKCTQVDTELVSVSLSTPYADGRSFSRADSYDPGPIPHRPISSRPTRHSKKLRRTYSDGHSRNTSEEYLLNSCTLDSSFTQDNPEQIYRYEQPKYSDDQLASRTYGNPYPHQPELVCNCVQPNYYYTSNSLPREKRHNAFYLSDQNISGRPVVNRSNEELIISQRSLDRKLKSKPQLSASERKARHARARERQIANTSKLFDLNFLPANKERSLDGEDYQIRNFNRGACSPGRCGHSSFSASVHPPSVHAPQCGKYIGFSGSFDRDTFDSQHVFVNKCEGACEDYFVDEYDAGKSCARSLPPHFGDEKRRSDSRLDGESRPRKNFSLGGRRVIVPDGCEQDDTFDMLYNSTGCQCERCDHAGYPGGYCHHQESLRPESRQSGSRSNTAGSGLSLLGVPPRALAARPPSLTSSSTGTSSKVDMAQRHWYAIATVLLVAGAAGVAVPLALRVSAGASLEERLEVAIALLSESPLIDGHNDLPWNIRKFLHNKLKDFRFSEDLRNIPPWSTSPWSHTDLPRLKKGLVSAQFWAAYVPCAAQHRDAVQLVLEQIDVVRRLTERYHPELVLCTSPKEIRAAHAAGRMCSLVGVEGGHALGGSLGVLRILHAVGVRYLTLTSTCDTPWAQCALADAMGASEPDHEGLAPFGKLIIKEMNRLGMMVDLSHVSRSTMRAALDASAAPTLFSHSSAHALCNSSRNVPDTVLRKVAANRGLVMVNFYSQFLACKNTATVADAVAHINHIKEVAGIDSVGLGAGYDGINFTPKGLEDVSTYPVLFAELLAAGWSTDELKKLAGLNFLRVFEEVERVRDEQAQAMVQPYEDVMQPKPGLAYNCTSQDLF